LRRIVRGAALVTVCSITNAGCGADRPPRDQSAARLTAAVLSQRDMPSDFLPAEDQQVFSRVEPADPDCRRLLVWPTFAVSATCPMPPPRLLRRSPRLVR
jgi:hypothetical protein